MDQGLRLYAIDASPTLLARFESDSPAFRQNARLPRSQATSIATFDGVIAWGLMFLLPEETQRTVLNKMARALKPGGRLLFTAQRAAVKWTDSITGQESHSLGAEEYESLLRELGFDIEPGRMDAGENYYYFGTKRS